MGNLDIFIEKAEKAKLKPKKYGISGTVSYTSSNTKIVSVSSKGKITAKKKKGTAYITITAGGYSVKCKVKVK